MTGRPRVTLLARQLVNAGAERQLYLLAAHLARADWDAHVISLGDAAEREHWAEPLRQLGMAVEHVPPGPVLARVARLRRLFRRHEPDVVHAFHVHVAPYAILARRSRSVPVVSGIRSLPESWYLQPTMWERVALYGSTTLVCKTQAARELLHRRFPRCASSLVIRNGAALPARSTSAEQQRIARARLALPQTAPVIGIVARHVEAKRVDRFLHAVAALWSVHRDLRAVVVGTGPENAALRRLAAGLPCASAITFVGEEADAVPLLPAFDVLCLTSDTEGMPNVLLEAGAWAIPVVATRVGGVPEVVVDGETGLLSASDDVPAIAACVDRLLRSPALRHAMGEAARRHVASTFGTDAMGSAYERLYVELAHDVRSRSGRGVRERGVRARSVAGART